MYDIKMHRMHLVCNDIYRHSTHNIVIELRKKSLLRYHFFDCLFIKINICKYSQGKLVPSNVFIKSFRSKLSSFQIWHPCKINKRIKKIIQKIDSVSQWYGRSSRRCIALEKRIDKRNKKKCSTLARIYVKRFRLGLGLG